MSKSNHFIYFEYLEHHLYSEFEKKKKIAADLLESRMEIEWHFILQQEVILIKKFLLKSHILEIDWIDIY